MVSNPTSRRVTLPVTNPVSSGAALILWADGTFANASERYIWDALRKRGYGAFAAGIAAIAHIDGKNRLQIEGARTNQMEDLSNWSYTSGASQTPGRPDPFGGTAASLLEAITTGSSAQGVLGGAANDALVQLTMFVKKMEDGDMRWFGGGAALGDWNPVVLDTLTEWNRLATHHPAVDEDDPWQATVSGALDIVLRAATGTLDLDTMWPQMEEATFPSSPIPPSSGAVTRAADSMQFAAGDVPAAFKSGKWTCELTTMHSDADLATGEVTYLFYVDASNHLSLTEDGVGNVQAKLATTSGNIVKTVTYSRDQTVSLTVDFVGGVLTTGGFTTGDGDTSGTVSDWPSTTLFVGSDSTPDNHIFGRISEPVAA